MELTSARQIWSRICNHISSFNRISEQAQRQLQKSSKFEDLNLGENRPTELCRRYGNLYSQTRIDAYDALDDLPEMAEFDDLKRKLLFSVVVVSYGLGSSYKLSLENRIRSLPEFCFRMFWCIYIYPSSSFFRATFSGGLLKAIHSGQARFRRVFAFSSGRVFVACISRKKAAVRKNYLRWWKNLKPS